MENNRIHSVAQRYKKYTLWLNAALVLIALFACRVSPSCDEIIPQVLYPIVVSVVFTFVSSAIYIVSWKSVAMSSPANLAKFYLVGSALKMLLAVATFLVYVVVCSKANILPFTLVFLVFYVVFLVFDCLYFAKVEKKN